MSDLHNDWPWPFKYIPRSWTSWPSNNPPKQLLGNVNVAGGEHLDEPAPGHWDIAWPPYFALVTSGKWFFRIGIRYDYNAKTYNPGLTIKKLS
jgi:hypothetical protein